MGFRKDVGSDLCKDQLSKQGASMRYETHKPKEHNCKSVGFLVAQHAATNHNAAPTLMIPRYHSTAPSATPWAARAARSPRATKKSQRLVHGNPGRIPANHRTNITIRVLSNDKRPSKASSSGTYDTCGGVLLGPMRCGQSHHHSRGSTLNPTPSTSDRTALGRCRDERESIGEEPA